MQKLVFDGGFGTECTRQGFIEDSDPLWSARLLVDQHEKIKSIHRSFLESGADAVSSGTYQASVEGLMKYSHCSIQQASSHIQMGAKLVKECCEEFWEQYRKNLSEDDNQKHSSRAKPIACVSLGPYGAFLGDGSEYTGSYVDTMSQQDLKLWHDIRLSLLSKEDLELYMFETIPSLEEAKAILTLTREYPQHKFTVTFSCKDGEYLCHGEKLKDAITLAERYEGIFAVGVNCTSPQYITSLLNITKNLVTNKKILIMPNSGEIWEDKRWHSNDAVQPLHCYVKEWIEAGADWIGGCCRTTPDEIKLIRAEVEKFVGKDDVP